MEEKKREEKKRDEKCMEKNQLFQIVIFVACSFTSLIFGYNTRLLFTTIMAAMVPVTTNMSPTLAKSRTPPVKLGLVFNSQSTKFHPNAVELEVFIDFACPFSKRIYDRLTTLVVPHYEQASPCKLKVVFQQVPQPWHPQSTLLHEAALAAWIIGGTSEVYQKAYRAILDAREQFVDAETYDKTRTQIYQELAKVVCPACGLDESKFLDVLKLDTSNGQRNSGNGTTQALKWYAKMHRQRTVHVTPTCAINGILLDTSSSWGLEDWNKLLDPVVDLL
jgi:protein-disulfide isomerase